MTKQITQLERDKAKYPPGTVVEWELEGGRRFRMGVVDPKSFEAGWRSSVGIGISTRMRVRYGRKGGSSISYSRIIRIVPVEEIQGKTALLHWVKVLSQDTKGLDIEICGMELVQLFLQKKERMLAQGYSNYAIMKYMREAFPVGSVVYGSIWTMSRPVDKLIATVGIVSGVVDYAVDEQGFYVQYGVAWGEVGSLTIKKVTDIITPEETERWQNVIHKRHLSGILETVKKKEKGA